MKPSLHSLIHFLPFLLNPLRVLQNSTQFSTTTNSNVFYVTTDGQPASLSWYKAPIWGLRPDLYYSYDNYGFFPCGAPSLTRGRVWLLYMLLALASAICLWSEPFGSRDHILLSHIWDFPFRRLLRLAGSRWRYSIPPPHGVLSLTHSLTLLDSADNLIIFKITPRRGQHRKHRSSVVPLVSVFAGTCLPSHCLETSVFDVVRDEESG
jgi:hypothetical protein